MSATREYAKIVPTEKAKKPMDNKYNPQAIEPEWQERWVKQNLFDLNRRPQTREQ